MKKLFVAVLAIAALVACQKEETKTIESSSKAVSIKIANTTTTRANTPASPAQDFVCASYEDLSVVFVDRGGNLVESYDLTAGEPIGGSYTFHALPKSVTGFFVIGTDGGKITSLPAKISDAEKMWKAEDDQVALPVTGVVVYGACTDLGEATPCTDPKDDTRKYDLYTPAAVRVAPYLARVEVSAITCNDLGLHNRDNDPTTLGYETLTLKTLSIGNYDGAPAYLTDSLDGMVLKTAADADGVTAKPVSVSQAEGVWSWNVTPKAASNYFVSLNTDVDAEPYYVVGEANKNRTITANKYVHVVDGVSEEVGEFKSGYVYKMTVPFRENDLDDNSSLICVDVEVSIAEWVVWEITPEF